ncbi:MAG: hypothetical protein EBR82_07880 [Caulobacteraceae bacterium]|nr:hypothetical protein [Caulobacteraceae bacterium]
MGRFVVSLPVNREARSAHGPPLFATPVGSTHRSPSQLPPARKARLFQRLFVPRSHGVRARGRVLS